MVFHDAGDFILGGIVEGQEFEVIAVDVDDFPRTREEEGVPFVFEVSDGELVVRPAG